MYQKCPLCNGTGKDPNYADRYCTACHGRRIINELTGLPPNYQKVTVLPQIELNNLKNPD